MTNSNRLSTIFLLIFGLVLAGCQKEEATEKTGQSAGQSSGGMQGGVPETIQPTTGGIPESAQKNKEEAKETLGETVDKTETYVDDSVITAKVKTDILSDPLLHASDIEVTTTNGVVKLSGIVDSQQSVVKSTEIAQGVEGVKSVENELVVKNAD